MTATEVLFFDVLGTIVDWRRSIAAEADDFLQKHAATPIDAEAFAEAWVERYDTAVETIRSGQRPFVSLDLLNMENLQACLAAFGLTPAMIPRDEVENLNLAWHRLEPWPDAVEGLSRLRQQFIVAPLSDGNTRMMVDVARHGGLPWDAVLGADMSHAYKPMPEVYIRACALLDVDPARAMLVAAHPYDLEAARGCGLKTAYISRKEAHAPAKATESLSRHDWDVSAHDLIELAGILS